MKAVFVYREVEHTPDSLINLYLLEHSAEYVSETDYQNWIDGLIQTGEGAFVITDPPSMEDVKKHQFSKTRKKILKERREFLSITLPGKKKGNRIDRMLETEENEIQAETDRRLAELSDQEWIKLLAEYQKNKERNHKNQFFDQKKRIDSHNESLTDKLIEEFDLPGKLDTCMDDMVKEIQSRVDNWLIKTPKIMVYYKECDWFDTGFAGYGSSLSRNNSEYGGSLSQIYSDSEEEWDEDDYDEEELEEEELCADNMGRFLSFMKDEWSETDDGLDSEIYKEESLYSYVIRYMEQTFPELNEQEDPDFRDILFDLYDEEIDNCTRTIEIKVDCSPLHVLSCLSKNPVYHELAERTIKSEKEKIALQQEELKKKQEAERLEAERKARLKESILQAMPDAYPDLYPLARKMKRHFVLHIGPTNSGKTYVAMQRLREAGEGIYLAPLRLLAYEQYEKLNADGLSCSLITGEEREIREDAKIQASTVEMMDPIREYPVAVIDEAQMIGDENQGWAWTAAILGICCPEIHICTAPFAKTRLESLITECGDTFEVIWHKRQTKLTKSETAFQFPRSVQKHDALIVFSKKNVHAVAYELRKQGVTCSIIYGNLPYDVRQAEARRFASGETDVLVSTDAIGMGLNLPIQRVVFWRTANLTEDMSGN